MEPAFVYPHNKPCLCQRTSRPLPNTTAFTMHLPRLLASLPALLSRAETPEPATVYGYWKLGIYETWLHTGKHSVYQTRTEFWTPGGSLMKIVFCLQEYTWDTGAVDIPCNDTSFSSKVLAEYYPEGEIVR